MFIRKTKSSSVCSVAPELWQAFWGNRGEFAQHLFHDFGNGSYLVRFLVHHPYEEVKPIITERLKNFRPMELTIAGEQLTIKQAGAAPELSSILSLTIGRPGRNTPEECLREIQNFIHDSAKTPFLIADRQRVADEAQRVFFLNVGRLDLYSTIEVFSGLDTSLD